MKEKRVFWGTYSLKIFLFFKISFYWICKAIFFRLLVLCLGIRNNILFRKKIVPPSKRTCQHLFFALRNLPISSKFFWAQVKKYDFKFISYSLNKQIINQIVSKRMFSVHFFETCNTWIQIRKTKSTYSWRQLDGFYFAWMCLDITAIIILLLLVFTFCFWCMSFKRYAVSGGPEK